MRQVRSPDKIPLRYFENYHQSNGHVAEATSLLAHDFFDLLRVGDPKIWLDSDSGSQQLLRPRTLVLTDWTLKNPENESRLEDIERFLTHLFSDYPLATLYVWQDNHFAKLNNLKDITQLNRLVKGCLPIKKSNVIKALAKEQIAADHVMIMDQHAMRYLYADQLPQQSLLFSDITGSPRTLASPSTAHREIVGSLEPNTNIIFDQYPCDTSKWLDANPPFRPYPTEAIFNTLTVDKELTNRFLDNDPNGVPPAPPFLDEKWSSNTETLNIIHGLVNNAHITEMRACLDTIIGWLKHSPIKNLYVRSDIITLDQMQGLLSSIGSTLETFKIERSGFIRPLPTSLNTIIKCLSNAPLKTIDVYGELNEIKNDLLKINFAATDEIIFSCLKTDSFYNLTSLTLRSVQLSVTELASLERVAPNLQHLSLLNCRLLGDNFNILKPESLIPLKYLSLANYLNLADLKTLLLAAPNIKTLDRSISIIFNHFDGPSEIPPLKNLEVIDLKSHHVNNKTLQNLLIAGPDITTLDISGCTIIERVFSNLGPNALPELRAAHLSSTNTNSDNLIALLLAAPNLRFLDISRVKNIKEAFSTLKPNSLPKLTDIDLAKTEIDTKNLRTLLEAAPNLVSINLGSNNDMQKSVSYLKPNSLPELRMLDLTCTNITTPTLIALSQAAPKLNKLIISQCNELDGTLSQLSAMSFAQVKIIDIEYTKLSNNDLKALLAAAPNLSSLKLGYKFQDVKGLSSLKHHSLPKLKKFETIQSNIHPDDLYGFLNATPNITSLFFAIEEYAKGGLAKLMPNSLPELCTASFESCYIDDQDLGGLLKAAPKLEELTLNRCPIITELNFPLQPGSLPHLKKINLDNKMFSDEELHALQEAAPNAVINKLADEPGFSSNKSHSSECRTSQSNPSKKSTNLQPKFKNTIDPFNYAPSHRTFSYKKPEADDISHRAIIMQFSQYLTLKDREDLVPKIQDGICEVLSNISLKYPYFYDWKEQLKKLSHWDGKELSSLEEATKNLLRSFFEVLFYRDRNNCFYTPEDALKCFLNKIESNSSFCLVNPWHSIAINIKKISTTDSPEKDVSYEIYDPNYPASSEQSYGNLGELYKALETILGPNIGIKINSDDHKLSEVLKTILEPNVSIENDTLDYEFDIPEVNAFIKTGGLLWLISHHCNNADAIYEAIHEYCEENAKNFSSDIIRSILMRNIDASPVWYLGLNHHDPRIRTLFYNHFIPRFEACFSHGSANQLIDSLKFDQSVEKKMRSPVMEEKTKSQTCKSPSPTLFTHNVNTNLQNFIQKIEQAARKQQLINSLTETYQTALSLQCEYQELLVDEDYLHTILFADVQNVLAKTSEPEALINQLYQYCSQEMITDHVFVIRNANQLSCASAYLKPTDVNPSRSVLTPGPGGPLYDFLQQATANPNTTYWIFIDYANFTAEECVRLNDIISDERLADGTAVPEHVRIIGVTSPSNYAGLDFDSRFQRKFIVSSNQTVPMPSFPEAVDDTPSTHVIDLQNREDWQAIFNGELTFGYTDHEMYFEQAQGIKAAVMDQLKDGDILELKNAPLTNSQFRRYWNSLAAHYHNKGFKLRYSTGYDWATLSQGHKLSREDHAKSGIITINPQLLQQCFSRFNVDTAQHQLHFGDGVLKEHEGKHLTLQLTHTLIPCQWARLFTEANKLNVTLNIRCLNGVTLPDALASSLRVTMDEEAAAVMIEDRPEFNSSQPSNVIFSDNVDQTTACLEEQFDSAKCLSIDVTEMTAADLIERVDVKMEQDPPKISFDLKTQVLLQRLKDNQTVILKGPVPSVLAQHLYPLILKYPQQLFIVTTPDDLNWHALPTQYHQDAIVEAKPVSDSLTTLNKPDLKPYSNFSDSNQLAAAFDQDRIHAVTAALAQSPIAILNGITGTGKTTFVKNILTKADPRILYTDHGLADRQLWARNRNGGLLLIDEANLEHGDFSVFEGLFAKQPYIILDGTHHPLTSKHQVIFCQNPASYGSGREVKRLFIRHDNSVVFNPLPLSYIHARILSPILKDLPEALSLMAHESLLALYHFIYDCSQDRVLISARELKTMAQMMVRVFLQADKAILAQRFKRDMAHIIKLVAEPLVPSYAQTEFAQQFLTDLNQSTWEPRCIEEPLFVLTELWQQPYAALTKLLALRDQHNNGGLGGLVLEGDPSLGKSQFFKAVLAENAIPYQHIPANLHTQEKEQRLLDAFYKGEIVVIDELSSQGNLERLLNELLMGHHPLDKTPQPGFMVLGTQNPIHMAGRRSASQALRRRLLTYELGDYQPHEVEQICEILLTRRGFKGKDLLCQIEALAKAYQALKNSGKAVSLRSVVRVVANAETPQDQKILAAAAPMVAPSRETPPSVVSLSSSPRL